MKCTFNRRRCFGRSILALFVIAFIQLGLALSYPWAHVLVVRTRAGRVGTAILSIYQPIEWTLSKFPGRVEAAYDSYFMWCMQTCNIPVDR
jgi:hypothetical protein